MNNLRATFLCLLSLCSSAGVRAQSCEDSFHAEGSEATGMRLTVQRTFLTMDPYRVIDWIQNQLQVGGRPGGIVSYKGSQATLDADVGTHLHFVADKSNRTLTLILSTTPGKPYDLNRGRKGMCDMVFKSTIDGTTNNAPNVTTSPASSSNAASHSGQSPGALPPGTILIRPKSAFDAVAAQKAMEPGTSVVRGTACAVHASGNAGGLIGEHASVVILPTNAEVFLYPDTPYAEEAINLAKDGLKKYPQGGAQLDTSAEFKKFRQVTTTDENGNFQFTNIKPGSYLVVSALSADIHGAKIVDDGDTRVGDVIYQSSHTQYSNFAYDDLLQKHVDVKSDGQTIKIDLKPAQFGGVLTGCNSHIIPHKKVDQRQFQEH